MAHTLAEDTKKRYTSIYASELYNEVIAMDKKCKKGLLHAIGDTIQSIFINGLLVLLPITITIAIITYTVKLVQRWLQPIHRIEPAFLEQIPYSEFIFALVTIFVVGIIFKSFFLRTFLHTIERTFFNFPLMRQLYFGIKQIVLAFTTQDQIMFQRVVLVEFPRKEMYSLGFLTSETPVLLLPNTQKKYYNIYIPTTPNPTSGYLIIIAEDDIIDIDLTRQEAMSLIISGGIIRPERFKKSTENTDASKQNIKM